MKECFSFLFFYCHDRLWKQQRLFGSSRASMFGKSGVLLFREVPRSALRLIQGVN